MQLSHFGRAGLLAGALVGGAMLLGACGSSSTTPASSNTGGGSTTTTAGGGNTGGGSTTTTAGGGNTGGGATTTTAGSGLNALAQSLQSGETQSYDATYKATEENGTSQTIEFASSPPSNFAYIVNNSSGMAEYIGTASHSYGCSQKSAGGSWTCIDYGTAGLGAYSALVQVYQGKFWYQDVLALKAEAGMAGFTEKSSTMSLAGQTLNCVTWSGGPAGANGGGEVCVTSTGVLGYVHAIASNTTFELTSLTGSPAASKFQTPAGAQIISLPAGG